jgi:hypothetical protein
VSESAGDQPGIKAGGNKLGSGEVAQVLMTVVTGQGPRSRPRSAGGCGQPGRQNRRSVLPVWCGPSVFGGYVLLGFLSLGPYLSGVGECD